MSKTKIDTKNLCEEIIKWWEENRYATFPTGDGEEDNLFTVEPKFVTLAKAMLASQAS